MENRGVGNLRKHLKMQWRYAVSHLVAPYCAIPRDYLSDTPHIARYGVFGVSTWPIGCDTPSPFSQRFPLGEHSRSGGAIPPFLRGYLSDTRSIPHENKANGCDTPLCDTISKGYCAIWGVSRTGLLRSHRATDPEDLFYTDSLVGNLSETFW